MLERNRDNTRERCAQARIIDVGVIQPGGGGQGRKRSNISKKGCTSGNRGNTRKKRGAQGRKRG